VTAAALYLAHDGWENHMGDWGAGWWVVMVLMMVVFWGLVIAGVVWLVRYLARGAGNHRGPSAVELLDQRLARGGVSIEEYRERRRVLTGDGEGNT
jgi:putative membrane protein